MRGAGKGGVINHVGIPFGSTREGRGGVVSGPIGGKKQKDGGGNTGGKKMVKVERGR